MSDKKRGPEAIFSGLAMTALFLILYLNSRAFFWLFPLFFAGVVPTIEGLRRTIGKYVANRKENRRVLPKDKKAFEEKTILKVARNNGGVITPSLVAVESELTIENAGKRLDEMAGKGFTSMEVTDSGQVEYHFPEFKKQLP